MIILHSLKQLYFLKKEIRVKEWEEKEEIKKKFLMVRIIKEEMK